MKRKTFTPKELNDKSAWEGMTELSSCYFKVASELRDKSKENSSGHKYVFPSVIMYVSSLEAFLNENLTLSSTKIDDEELKEEINMLKAGQGKYNNFGCRLKEIFKIYDKKSKGLDTNGLEYQNILALVELRNSVIHYNPLFIEHIKWPDRLQQALQRSKIKVKNSGWVGNFNSPEVAVWAYETIKSVVVLFSQISGGINPFDCPEEHSGFRWEQPDD